MTQQLPNGKQQFIDINGKPLVGGLVNHYSVGTFTPKTTYQDSLQTIPNTNPVVCDARGQASIYGTGPYRQVLTDSLGNLIWDQVVLDPSNSVTQFFLDLANKVDPTKGSSLVGWVSPLANAVGRTLSEKLQDYISVKDFGAKGDGIQNDTPFINNAMEQANIARKAVFFPAGVYMVDESTPGSGYCILNKGVSMYGEGALRVQIVPKATLVATADYILLQPTASTVLDFVEISGIFIYPNNPGSKRGKRALFVDMTQISNASSVHIDGCYFAPGNDYSMEWYTDPGNVQGGPANSLFERSHFWEGVKLTNQGDSNTFRNCVMRSSVGSSRIGVNTKSIAAGGGQSSQLTIEQCNIDCDGGALFAFNGLKLTVINNNIEQSHGAGSASGACIDFDGSAGGVAWAVFAGNSIGAFGTSTLSTIIRLGGAAQTKVSHNRISSATAANAGVAIFITGVASDTIIEQNEIGTNFPVSINEAGIGTRGVPKTITPINGFTNTGAGTQPLAIYKHPSDGRLFLNGTLTPPGGGGSGLIFGNLPSGFRYGFVMDLPALAIVGGSYVACRISIQTNGDMQLLTTGVATQVFLSASWGGLGFVNGNL